MADVPHFPALRAGEEYESLDVVELCDHASGAPVARVSQVNAGIVRRDLKRREQNAAVLRRMGVAELIERCQAAATHFLEDALPVGGDQRQTPEQYVAALSATSGLPYTFCRANMQKNATVLREMPRIVWSLSRGLELGYLDSVAAKVGDTPVWFPPATPALAAILPSNSPGVHSLWIPSVALKTPLLLKPGREEPWTPMRLARALLAAGVPKEAFGLYPTDHEGARALLEGAGRALLFGDEKTTAPWAGDPRVEIHGPGRSKVLLGDDVVDRWEEHLDVLVRSVAANGGRSCINASAIFVPRHADAIAEGLAKALARLEPRRRDDPEAQLAAFAKPAVAAGISARIDQGLSERGARDVSAAVRAAERRVELDGSTFLLPTVVRCESVRHPLANTEYLFPFTSVVEVPQAEMTNAIGPSLVVSAITRDAGFQAELLASRDIHRLNLGPVPTSHVEWDQPHEGNLFDFLYTRRALQRAGGW